MAPLKLVDLVDKEYKIQKDILNPLNFSKKLVGNPTIRYLSFIKSNSEEYMTKSNKDSLVKEKVIERLREKCLNELILMEENIVDKYGYKQLTEFGKSLKNIQEDFELTKFKNFYNPLKNSSMWGAEGFASALIAGGIIFKVHILCGFPALLFMYSELTRQLMHDDYKKRLEEIKNSIMPSLNNLYKNTGGAQVEVEYIKEAGELIEQAKKMKEIVSYKKLNNQLRNIYQTA